MTQHRYCVFCEIIAGTESATIRYRDDDVVVFDNVLGWTQVMMLAVPTRHQSQSDLWSDLGPVGRAAAAMGREHSPDGFRLLSNFGHFGMQSQPHGHIHILDDTEPLLEQPRDPQRSIVDIVTETEQVLLETPHARVFDERRLLPHAPVMALALPVHGPSSQRGFWQDVGPLGADLVELGWTTSESGFRLIANFPQRRMPGGEKAHVHLMGGTFLGHYV